VIAADADGDTITYSAQSLPTGATFSNQTFSWTPGYEQAGAYQVTFIAGDGKAQDSETVAITVNNVNRPPVLAAIGNKSVSENNALSFSVSATDTDGDTVTYSYSGLPAGASFSSQTFNWTPTYAQTGTYQVTFTASDGQAQDSEIITITVGNVNRPPVLSSIGNKSVYASGLLTFTVSAADPDGDTTAFSTGTLPAGATFAGQSFNWQPDSAKVGSHQVTFTASDGTLQDSETITITVLNTDTSPPVVANCSPGADSIQIPLNTLVVLHIADAGDGVDAGSVAIKVNDDVIYSGNTPAYSSAHGNCRRLGTKADYTYVYQSNEMFDLDRDVTVTVNAADLAGNVMSQRSYSFTTEMRSFGQNKKVGSGSDTLSKTAPATVWDSAGNIWAAWHAGPAGSRDIYVGKLAAGADNFGSSIRLTQSTADQCNPAVAIGSDDKLYVAWQDNRSGTWDIYVSISSDGVSWSAEKRVTDTNDNQVNPAIAVDTSNRAYIVWQDDRNVNQDIYIAASSNGFVTETVSQITSNIANQIEPAIAVDSSNTVYVVWTDARNGSSDIYGAASNKGPWTNVPIVNNAGNQSSSAIAAGPEGSVLHLLWVDDRSGNQDIYYATSNGLPSSSLSGSSIIDDTSGANQLAPEIITNSSSKVFACWQDQRNVAANGGDTDLYLAELTSDSRTNVLVGDDGTNSNQSEPAMGIGEYGHPYLVWTDGRSANTEIYYAGSTFVDPVAMKAKDISASLGATIGTDPAIIGSVDDVSVVVPAGACLCDTKIAISKIKNPEAFAMQYLGSYDFGPSGMEFSQPVTITIPYVVPVSGTPASVYWYNSLTGALSQGGITDLVNLQISSSLNALRFSSVHFTPFYLLFRNCVASPITKCSVKNGKIPGAGQDSIQISGVIGVASNDLVNADDINIAIKSVADNHLVFSESIKFNPNSMRKGKYNYSHKFRSGKPGGIASFQLDLNKHTFALQIQNVDLTGLTWPMSVEIEIGDYVGVGRVESRPKK
jgi:PKD repeat protein